MTLRRDRALLLALVALALAVAAFCLRQFGTGWMPGCFFHMVTGLDCPGCGMTRGTYALLQGQIGRAFSYNPVGMILLPIALIAVGIELVGWVFDRPISIRPGPRVSAVLAAVVIGWFILRNLP